MLIQPIVESIVAPAFGALSRAVQEPVPAFSWILLVSVWFAVVLALRVVDRAPWSDIGLGEGAWKARRLLAALALGSVAIALTALLLFAGGWMRFESAPVVPGMETVMLSPDSSWWPSALRWLLLLAPAALWEELLFRGYLWTVVDDAAGTLAALLTTSVLFGLVHLTNPGSGVRTTLLVVLAGLCLGLIRMRTASLPAAWLAHLAWNWIMAAVLRAPVSGMPVPSSGYRAVVSGPAWLTGGEWGPEGGAVAALTMGGALMIALRKDLTRLMTTKRNEA